MIVGFAAATVALIAYAIALRLRYFTRCRACDRGEGPGSLATHPLCECRLSERPDLGYFAAGTRGRR